MIAAAPSCDFSHNAATAGGVVVSNVEAYTGSPSAKASDLGLSYGLLGNATAALQDLNGAWTSVGETYYPNGVAASLSVPGAPVISYGVDGEGRPTTVSASAGQNPVTAAAYSALGLTSLTLGSGAGASFTYAATTGRMSAYQFTLASASDAAQLGWNANGSLGSLAITDSIPGASDNGPAPAAAPAAHTTSVVSLSWVWAVRSESSTEGQRR